MHLILDESGTHDCRYLVIGGAYMKNPKPLMNKMKKLSLKVKRAHPEYAKFKEVKSSKPDIKEFFLKGIKTIPGLEVRYIVADKERIYGRLKDNPNLFITYLMGHLVEPIAKSLAITGEPLTIWFDNRSIKTGSLKMEEFLKLKLYAEWQCDIDLSVTFYESSNNFAIQGAHYIANGIWVSYERKDGSLLSIIDPIVGFRGYFPPEAFDLAGDTPLQVAASYDIIKPNLE